MRYIDLTDARAAFERGENVTEHLRRRLGVDHNTPEVIEIAYDLQAGSYVAYVLAQETEWRARCERMAGHLAPHVTQNATVLDAGTGEMTTLTGLAPALAPAAAVLACDLSWSRLRHGRTFLQARLLSPAAVERFTPFVGDLLRLPLADGAVDVVTTCHALEPNGSREREAVAELARVARRRLVLFEPSYEHNTSEGRARMERLGYVRNLPAAIEAAGCRLESVTALAGPVNPLNPTYVYVATPPARAWTTPERGLPVWVCPATGLPLEQRADCFFSPRSMLAYPILGGIPVLRAEAALLATALA